MKKYRLGFCLFIIVLISSCSKDEQTITNNNQETTLSFYNLDAAVATPVQVYVDSKLVGSTSASYMANHLPDCGNMGLNIHPTPGPHIFALVASNGYYATGNFSIGEGRCLAIPYSGEQFTSINYGTDNGTLSIMTNVLNLNPITVWIDNNNVGTLQGAAITYICGENRSGYVISLVLPPGQHTYKAVENMSNGGTRTWQGTRVISPNQCQPLVFSL